MAQAFDRAWMVAEGRAHWKRNLPKLYAQLKNSGQLEKELAAAADRTLQEMQEYVEAGMTPAEAWPEVRADFLILDPETYNRPSAP